MQLTYPTSFSMIQVPIPLPRSLRTLKWGQSMYSREKDKAPSSVAAAAQDRSPTAFFDSGKLESSTLSLTTTGSALM